MIDTLQKYWEPVTEILGFSPILMIPVFVLVSLIAWLLKIRTRIPEWKDFVLGVLCLVVGCAMAATGEYDGVKGLIRDGVILGSLSALAYQIFKGLFEGIGNLVKAKWKEATGEDLEIEDNETF